MNSLIASKSVSTGKDSIKGIDGDNIVGSNNMDDEVNVVGVVNTGFLAFGTGFFTLGTRLTFTKLREVFNITPILHYFNPESHIQIETNASGYAIGGIFSQLTLNGLSQ